MLKDLKKTSSLCSRSFIRSFRMWRRATAGSNRLRKALDEAGIKQYQEFGGKEKEICWKNPQEPGKKNN